MEEETYRPDDGIQHGIDDNPHDDAKKGATLGGLGGAAVGAAAGAMTGPVGAVIGAVAGGVAGAVASGAAVGAIDTMDNDNNITGLGEDVASDHDVDDEDDPAYAGAYADPGAKSHYADPNYAANTYGGASATGGASGTMGYDNVPTNTDGWDAPAAPETRPLGEKAGDAAANDDCDSHPGNRMP